MVLPNRKVGPNDLYELLVTFSYVSQVLRLGKDRIITPPSPLTGQRSLPGGGVGGQAKKLSSAVH